MHCVILTLSSSNDFTLYPVDKAAEGGPLNYICNPQAPIRLPGAHGEEIVRDLFTDIHVRSNLPTSFALHLLTTLRPQRPTRAAKMASCAHGRCQATEVRVQVRLWKLRQSLKTGKRSGKTRRKISGREMRTARRAGLHPIEVLRWS